MLKIILKSNETMNQLYKHIIALLVVVLCSNPVMWSQEKETSSSESVIVMTQAQLDSLLTSIANQKRAQLARIRKRKAARAKLELKLKELRELQTQKPRTTSSLMTTNTAQNNSGVYQALNQLDKRIDRLMRYQQMQEAPKTVNNYYVTRPAPSTTTILSRPTVQNANPNPSPSPQTRLVAPQYQPQEPNKTHVSGARMDSLNAALTARQAKLQAQIGALKKQLHTLQADSLQKKEEEYAEEVGNLKSNIERLGNQLEAARAQIMELRNKKPEPKPEKKTALELMMQRYSQKVYFANNSTAINAADRQTLIELSNMVKRSPSPVTVLLQGYASSSGKATYNKKISMQRAKAVKQILVDNGISSHQIMLMAHGVDKSTNPQNARRVEVYLLVE